MYRPLSKFILKTGVSKFRDVTRKAVFKVVLKVGRGTDTLHLKTLLSIDTIAPEGVPGAVLGLAREPRCLSRSSPVSASQVNSKSCRFQPAFCHEPGGQRTLKRTRRDFPGRVQTSYCVFNETFLLSWLEKWRAQLEGGLCGSMCYTKRRPWEEERSWSDAPTPLGREFQTLTHERSPFL